MVEIWINIVAGFREIFSSPFRDLSILWILTPIILFWFALEIYFGKYKGEKIGWNTALGYGLSMFWIVVISFKTLFENNFELFSVDKLIFLIVVSAYSIFIIYVSFTHKLKEKIFFLFTSPTIVYFLLAIAILWAHGLLNITLWVFIDLIILYILILIFETILKKLIPAASEGSGSGGSGGGDTDIGKGFGKT